MQNPLWAFHTLTVVSQLALIKFRPPQHRTMSLIQSLWCSNDCTYELSMFVAFVFHILICMIWRSSWDEKEDEISFIAHDCIPTATEQSSVVMVKLEGIHAPLMSLLFRISNHKRHLKSERVNISQNFIVKHKPASFFLNLDCFSAFSLLFQQSSRFSAKQTLPIKQSRTSFDVSQPTCFSI